MKSFPATGLNQVQNLILVHKIIIFYYISDVLVKLKVCEVTIKEYVSYTVLL